MSQGGSNMGRSEAIPDTQMARGVGFLKDTFVVEDSSLTVVSGPHQGQSVSLDRETLYIGRSEWCDLVLSQDLQVSARHCEISVQPDGIRVRDLSSSNGIFLGDNRILEAYLTPSTPLQVGQSTLVLQNHQQQRELSIPYRDASGLLVGKSPKMRKLFHMLERLSQRDVALLLLGETGTGKTSIAHALHQQSLRAQGPFVVVDCGSLPPSLIESSLFGNEKGAFTGADRQHKGYFEQAHQGTLFLDEIGELPLEMQPKLLSALESQRFQRVGGTSPISVDFRLVAATHRDLQAEVKSGRFREDLYYRLSVVELEVSPLRERPEDIPLLAEGLLKQLVPEQRYQWSMSAIKQLQDYLWPGNVRQLRNVLERTITFLEGNTITPGDLLLPSQEPETTPSPLTSLAVSSQRQGETGGIHMDFPGDGSLSLKQMIEETERVILTHAMTQHQDNVRKSAAMLDISLPWIYKRLKKYGLKE